MRLALAKVAPNLLSLAVGAALGILAFRPAALDRSEDAAEIVDNSLTAILARAPSVTGDLKLAEGVRALSIDGCAALLNHLRDSQAHRATRNRLIHELAEKLAGEDLERAAEILESQVTLTESHLLDPLARALCTASPERFIELVKTEPKRQFRHRLAKAGYESLALTDINQMGARFEALLIASGAGDIHASFGMHEAATYLTGALAGIDPPAALAFAEHYAADIGLAFENELSSGAELNLSGVLAPEEEAKVRAAARNDRLEWLAQLDPDSAMEEIEQRVAAGNAETNDWRDVLFSAARRDPAVAAEAINRRIQADTLPVNIFEGLLEANETQPIDINALWQTLSDDGKSLALQSFEFKRAFSRRDPEGVFAAAELLSKGERKTLLMAMKTENRRASFNALLDGRFVGEITALGTPPLNSREIEHAFDRALELDPRAAAAVLKNLESTPNLSREKIIERYRQVLEVRSAQQR